MTENSANPSAIPDTAAVTLSGNQGFRHVFAFSALTVFFLWDYKIAFTVATFALCLFYLAAVGARLVAAFAAWRSSPELRVTPEAIAALPGDALPTYTILAPLYREANIADSLVAALRRLDYPADKLEVLLLLEENDRATRAALDATPLPEGWRLIVVPEGHPRTKPRACNIGLAAARGEYLVIYDAEDRPEPDQLKKAVAAFQGEPPEVACLQAKLNYHNPDQNWLTRFFTLEYTAWFDLFLPGLYHLGFPIPLGGTSNHFRAHILKQLGGWDAHNVTEDCDLGIRLARHGYQTGILDSTTWEEANSRLGNWLRQRSRWVKGYLQTHFVHTRHPLRMARELGGHGLAGFLLTVGGLAATLLLNPLYWLMLLAWVYWRWPLAYFDFTNAEQLAYTGWSKMSWVFCGISLVLFAANFALIALNLLACRRRNLWRLWPYALLWPFYWLLISAGAWKGAAQLLRRPHHWEKTEHGLDQ